MTREKELPIILDAGPVRDLDFSLLHGLEIISPNETETKVITGIEGHDIDDTAAAARRLVEIAPSRYAVIKLGERGALIYDRERNSSEYIPGYPVAAVDSTAMTAHYLRYRDLNQAVRYANAAGAVAVTLLGAQPSLPTEKQVGEFIRRWGLELRGA